MVLSKEVILLKYIDDYKEFEYDSDISVLDHISETEIPEKKKVLEYLTSFEVDGVRCASLTDFIKKQILSKGVCIYTDGEYVWDDEEIYHFEKYNMELNKDFINKVLSQR